MTNHEYALLLVHIRYAYAILIATIFNHSLYEWDEKKYCLHLDTRELRQTRNANLNLNYIPPKVHNIA